MYSVLLGLVSNGSKMPLIIIIGQKEKFEQLQNILRSKVSEKLYSKINLLYSKTSCSNSDLLS